MDTLFLGVPYAISCCVLWILSRVSIGTHYRKSTGEKIYSVVDRRSEIRYCQHSQDYKDQCTANWRNRFIDQFYLETEITQAEAKKLYDLKFEYTGTFRRVLFSKSTITQLKNSGNLRLIKEMNIADSIVKYDLAIEFVDKFADHVTEFVNDNYKAEYEIFSDEFWQAFVSEKGYDSQKFDLMTYDPKTLRIYASRLTHQSASMTAYITLGLPSLEQKAVSLIEVLKKEYHVK